MRQKAFHWGWHWLCGPGQGLNTSKPFLMKEIKISTHQLPEQVKSKLCLIHVVCCGGVVVVDILQKACNKTLCSAKSQDGERRGNVSAWLLPSLIYQKSSFIPWGVHTSRLHHPTLQQARVLPCSVAFQPCLEVEGSSAPRGSATTHR